jgi:acyl-CoA thioesterase
MTFGFPLRQSWEFRALFGKTVINQSVYAKLKLAEDHNLLWSII